MDTKAMVDMSSDFDYAAGNIHKTDVANSSNNIIGTLRPGSMKLKDNKWGWKMGGGKRNCETYSLNIQEVL
jgi:hypothetical protein